MCPRWYGAVAESGLVGAAFSAGARARGLVPLDACPLLRANGEKHLIYEDKLLRQCGLGEQRWLATAFRVEILARLAQSASKVSAIQGSGSFLY